MKNHAPYPKTTNNHISMGEMHSALLAVNLEKNSWEEQNIFISWWVNVCDK